MPITFDDMLEKMSKAPLRRGGGNYIQGDGLFEVEILSTMRKMGWNKTFTVRDKELFIVEFRIVSVQSGDPEVPKNNAVGTTRSWTCKDPSNGGEGDVKNFVIAATGIDPRAVKDTDEKAQLQASLLALAAMGEAEAFTRLKLPENFFVGRRLALETKTIQTKSGGDFTKHLWSPAAPPAATEAA